MEARSDLLGFTQQVTPPPPPPRISFPVPEKLYQRVLSNVKKIAGLVREECISVWKIMPLPPFSGKHKRQQEYWCGHGARC